MGLYERRILPWLIHQAMRSKELVGYRARVTGRVQGRVLELGIGSGLNLGLYRDVELVVGIDPSERLLARAAKAGAGAGAPVRLLRARAEALPLPDGSVDAVVSTWTFCTIPDPLAALAEVRRVLRPGGLVAFVEHGASPDARVRRWQDRLNPLWRRIAGGCNLNREIDRALEAAGFRVMDLERGYGHGPKVAAYLYQGAAAPG